MSKFNELFNFIDRAEKSRNYPKNTALGLKTALKLFEDEINEEEKNSLDKFEENLDRIYQEVTRKNGNKFSAGSLATYRSRIGKVLEDYKKYGVDPTKMSNWPRKPINRVSGSKKNEINNQSRYPIESKSDIYPIDINNKGSHTIELKLRPDSNSKIMLVVPNDLKKTELSTIKSVLDSLVRSDDSVNQ
jgi:hypothetical protein